MLQLMVEFNLKHKLILTLDHQSLKYSNQELQSQNNLIFQGVQDNRLNND
jgi:hypothetical protein